jgi:hypothetical protein
VFTVAQCERVGVRPSRQTPTFEFDRKDRGAEMPAIAYFATNGIDDESTQNDCRFFFYGAVQG